MTMVGGGTSPVTEQVNNSETHTAELVADFAWDGHKLEPGIGITLSGGGFRAMLFHAGALTRLNELALLSKANRISSVSGGSIAAGYLAAVWSRFKPNETGVFRDFSEIFVAPLLAFSRQNLDIRYTLEGLLPGISAAARIAASYDKHLFKGISLQHMPDVPRFVICASNLQTGVLWRFSKPYAGDYIVGRLGNPTIPLAQAVAASSAFPPFLSPMKLRLGAERFTDWPSTGEPIVPVSDINAYRGQVVLTDGGVYDNHGIEPVLKRYMTVFVSDGGAPFSRASTVGWDWVRQLKRILDVTDNQVRALRRRDLISRFRAGNIALTERRLTLDSVAAYERFGAYWGIDTDPDTASPPGALPCPAQTTNQLARVSTRLADLGEIISKQLVNWGYAVCDRCVRQYYSGKLLNRSPEWPFGDASL